MNYSQKIIYRIAAALSYALAMAVIGLLAGCAALSATGCAMWLASR